jgi:hypothetical protein
MPTPPRAHEAAIGRCPTARTAGNRAQGEANTATPARQGLVSAATRSAVTSTATARSPALTGGSFLAADCERRANIVLHLCCTEQFVTAGNARKSAVLSRNDMQHIPA